VASLSQGRTAAAQCGLFTHKSVPVIFEPPCTLLSCLLWKLYKTHKYTLWEHADFLTVECGGILV